MVFMVRLQFTDDSTHTALLLAGGFALTGAVVSLTRIRLPLPEGLARQKK